MAEIGGHLKKKIEDQNRREAERAAKEAASKAEDEKVQKAVSDTVASVYATKAAAMPSGAQTMKTAPATQYAAALQNPVGASTAPLQYVVPEEVKQKLEADEAAKKEADALAAYAKRQEQIAADRAVMDAGTAELAQWSEGDRKALGQYVAQRNVAQANMLTGMYDPTATDAYMLNNPLVQKYGIGKVRQMAEIYERQQNEQMAKQTQEKSAAMVTGKLGNAIGQSAASVGANLIGNVTGTVGRGMEMMNRTGQFSTLQQNTVGDLPSLYASAVRGKIAENIAGDEYDEEGNQTKEGGLLRQGGALAYQGLMSALDSGARILATGGTGSLVLAASGSFNQAISEASALGAAPAQAIVYATGKAALEAATEKIPLDELLKTAKGGTKALTAILKQAGVEMAEEEISMFGGLLWEAAVLQEKSSYKQQIAEAIANGDSYEQAKEKANEAVMQEALQTALVSGISGVISGTGGAIVGKVAGGDLQTPAQTEMAAEVATEPVAAEKQTEAITPAPKEVATEAAQPSLEQKAVQDAVDQMMGKEKPAQPEMAVQDESTVVNTDPDEHTPEEQRIINEYQEAVDNDLVDYVQMVKDNPGKKLPRYPLNPVTDQAAADIMRLTGIDVRGNKTEIESRMIEHILKDHGENGGTDRSMRDSNDIGRIQYVIDNYDEIEHGGTSSAYVYQNKHGRNAKAQTVVMKKKVNGTYFVVEAVPDTQKKTLFVVSAYMNKNGQKETASSLSGDAKASRFTSDNATKSDTVLNDSILENNAGVKGTGAAEQNFSGKAQYQDLLYEGNVQPDREGDVRPLEVPKTDLQGNPVSATSANVYGSQFTTDDLASEEEAAIARGDLSYMKITNDKAAEKAEATIEAAGGWDEAYIQFHDSVRDGVTSAEMAARGAMLLNHAAEVYEQVKATGNEVAAKEAKQKWISILMDVREMGTNTAQGLQALRMIRELSPPDKLDFAVASIKRMVGKMNLGNDVKIDENLLNEYRMAETDEQRNEIMTQIQQNVADQIPSTLLDKWTALRYMNMLGNLKTNVRNVAGNLGAAVAYRVKDQVAATMEDFVSVFNKDFQKTKSHTVSAELLKAAKADFDNIKSSVSAGGKYNERMSADGELQQGIMDKRRIFKSDNKVMNAAMMPLEAYRKGTSWMMNNKYFGDDAFGRGAYARALAGYLKANGVSGGDLSNVDSALMDKARSYAIKEAQEATFKDNTALANMASKLQKATGVVGQGIAPFTKTPANILTRAIEFSPAGLVDSAVKAAKAANPNTEVTGTDVINSIAKSVTGTALFGLGMLWQDQGFLFASESDDEEERKLDELSGKQPYSIEFEWPDGKKYSYTMDWVTPVSMPLFMGAELNKILQENGGSLGGLSFSDWVDVLTSVADPMIQMSMLQGINDSLNSIKFVENNLGQFVINAALSYLTQGLTNTLIGQIERSTEDTRMTTYVDENSNIPKFAQQAIGKASQKIPGWDYQQMEYRNVFGETEKNEGGLAYNLLSPGYLSEVNSDAVNSELRRLNETQTEKIAPPDIPKKIDYTDSKGNVHNNYQLTEKQYQMLAQVQGQTAKKALDSLVLSSSYKNLTDSQKAATIKAIYEYAAEKGKQAALGNDYYSTADAWISGTTESDLNAFIIQGSKKTLDNVIKNVVNRMSNDWEVSAAAKSDMEASWQSFRKMGEKTQEQILEDAASDTAKYLLARRDGVSVSSYLKAVDNVKDIKPENGNKQVSESQKYEAIANTKGVTQDEIDALMRAYMPDYDPDNGKTEKTEIRYDYLRQEMKLTPAKTIAAMRIASGDGKKADKFAAWKSMGMSDTQCNTLWNALESTAKNNPVDVVAWSNSQKK